MQPHFSDVASTGPDGKNLRPGPTEAEMDAITDDELVTESGVDPIYTTTEAAEFFDRSNQWLYWGMRTGIFLNEDGTKIDPPRSGGPGGRRRFTLPIIKEFLLASYRRGNVDPEGLRHILRRIRIAEMGGEWREREGWKLVKITKNRSKWVRPSDCELVEGEWKLKKGVSDQ